MSSIILKQFRNEGCLAYVLYDEKSREAAVVDPKIEDLKRYSDFLNEQNLTAKFIIDTHTHADHISASCELAQLSNATVVMSEKTTSERVKKRVGGGDTLSLGDEIIKIYETPGHTQDSLSFLAGNYLLTGDSLLFKNCGRTDFPGGDPELQYDSLYVTLAAFPDETIVAPAHDYEERSLMTLAEVKKINLSLQFKNKKDFVEYLNNRKLSLPTKLKESLKANQEHCFNSGLS